MTRFVKVTSFIAVLLVSVAAVMPSHAEGASPSRADKAALRRAIVACKAEAKGQMTLAPEIRQRDSVTEAMEGPSHHRRYDDAQRASRFGGSSGRAVARFSR